MRTKEHQRGVTLVEAAVVVAVAAVSLGALAPSFDRFVEKHRLEAAAGQLVADLQFARSQSVMLNAPLRVSLHQGAGHGCYVLHTGDAQSCTCRGVGPATCHGDARELKTVVMPVADGIAISGNVSSILFDPLHGTSTPSATFKLVAASGRAVHGVVNLMGRVRTCSPRGLLSEVPGFAAC